MSSQYEGAADTIRRLQHELMREKMENDRLRAALVEIAAGRTKNDLVAGERHAGTMLAARITQVARDALRV